MFAAIDLLGETGPSGHTGLYADFQDMLAGRAFGLASIGISYFPRQCTTLGLMSFSVMSISLWPSNKD